jgi:hypothetical protein
MGEGGTMWEITWEDGAISHLEEGCVDWFVLGHPDYGFPFGWCPGLPHT